MAFKYNSAVVDRILTNFAIERGMGQPGPGQILAPIVSVPTLTGIYGVYEGSRNNSDNLNLLRAPGAKVAEGLIEGVDTDTYKSIDRARKDKLPIEFAEEFDSLSQENQVSRLDSVARKNQHKVITQHEKDVHSKLWASSEAGYNAIYGADNVNTPSTKWNASNSTIGRNIEDAKDRLYENCGHGMGSSNGRLVLLMPKVVFNQVAYDPTNDVNSRIRNVDPSMTNAEQMATYFGVDEVVVPKNLVDGANRGQDGNWSYMWGGDNVGLFYIDESQSTDKMTLASTFAADQVSAFPFLGVQTYFDDKDCISYYVKTHAWYDVKVVSASCGQILYDVLT